MVAPDCVVLYDMVECSYGGEGEMPVAEVSDKRKDGLLLEKPTFEIVPLVTVIGWCRDMLCWLVKGSTRKRWTKTFLVCKIGSV